jgi:parallel beta-helix repeat protein
MLKYFNRIKQAAFFICLMSIGTSSLAATYYFSSSDGDDSRTAVQAQNQNTPWKSIEKLNAIFPSLQPGDRVLFKKGDVFYGEIIPTKSGGLANPIFFGSYGNGSKPEITGLQRFQNWSLKGQNIYETTLPELNSALNVVLVDSEIKAMGRFPNEDNTNKGYVTMETASSGSVSSSQLQAPTDFSGAEVVIRKNNWIIDRHLITSHSGNSVNYDPQGSWHTPRVGFGFFIQNHPGTLDKNGEWYYDKQSKKILLYYDKGNPSSGNIQVSTLGRVITIQNGVSNLTFSDLRITGANTNLVSITNSSKIKFENCELEFAGEFIFRNSGSKEVVIDNSKLSNSLNVGITLNWSDSGFRLTNSSINNVFQFPGMGRNGDSQSQGIFMSESSSDVIIESNSFTNIGYHVINFNGNQILVKNNYINTFCNFKDDGAAIYTYAGKSNTEFSNRKVQNNIIINGIGAREGTKPFGPADLPYVEGIYTDDNSSNVEISGNTIAHVKSSGIFIHNSRNINVINNNVYNVGYSLKIVDDNFGNAIRNITVRDNNFLQKSNEQVHVFASSTKNDLDQIGVFDNNIYARPTNDYLTFLTSTPAGRVSLDLNEWQQKYNRDLNSKKSPLPFPKGKITAVKSDNKISNGNYNGNNTNTGCWTANNNCNIQIVENSPLDGRAMKVTMSSPGFLTVTFGGIEKNKKYNLKFSAISNKKAFLNTYLRENQAPWERYSNLKSVELSTVRSEVDLIFTATETKNNAALLFQTFDENIIYHIDNIILEEVEVDEIDPESFFLFDYNRTNSNQNIPLPGSFVNLRGQIFNNTAPVPAYGSVLMLRNDGNFETPAQEVKVRITEPSNLQKFVEPDKINIGVSVEKDNSTVIDKVEIYMNGELLETLNQDPYVYIYEKPVIGNHVLLAKAFDSKNSVFESEPVNIIIEKNQSAPTILITSPKPGDNFIEGDQINIETNISGTESDIKFVEFFYGNTLIGTVSKSPFKLVWSNIPLGNHQLTVKVFDTQGGFSVSDPINITVSKLQVPSVKITSPANNSTFESNKNIIVKFEASSPNGTINKIELYKNSDLIGTADGNPNNITFSLDNLPIGKYNLVAKVYDNKGASAVSDAVEVIIIEPNIAPKISITTPKNGDEFPEWTDIRIEVDAEDPDGEIEKVEFYHGETLIETSTSSPFNVVFLKAPPGIYNLTAKAFDNKGSSTISDPIKITVNSQNEIPQIELVTPVNNQEFDAESNIMFTVMFSGNAENVSKVEFYQNNQLIGTSNVSPFTFEWKNVSEGEYIVKAVAKGGTPEVSKASEEVKILVKPKSNKVFRIISPTFNSIIPAGTDLEIQVEIPTSEKKIKAVEYYRGNQILGSNTTLPYSYVWKNISKGEYNLVARLVYEDNSVLLSNVVKIIVEEPKEPTISLNHYFQEPINGNEIISVVLDASFQDLIHPIVKVEYFANGKSIGSVEKEPFSLIWENMQSGIYTIEAIATDESGFTFNSEKIQLEIKAGEKEEIDFTYTIGPNPTTDYLSLFFQDLKEEMELEIMIISMSGTTNEIFSVSTVNSNLTLDVSFLRNGSYILYINNGKGYISSRKFIKK